MRLTGWLSVRFYPRISIVLSRWLSLLCIYLFVNPFSIFFAGVTGDMKNKREKYKSSIASRSQILREIVFCVYWPWSRDVSSPEDKFMGTAPPWGHFCPDSSCQAHNGATIVLCCFWNLFAVWWYLQHQAVALCLSDFCLFAIQEWLSPKCSRHHTHFSLIFLFFHPLKWLNSDISGLYLGQGLNILTNISASASALWYHPILWTSTSAWISLNSSCDTKGVPTLLQPLEHLALWPEGTKSQ